MKQNLFEQVFQPTARLLKSLNIKINGKYALKRLLKVILKLPCLLIRN